jgi:signal transduction histidine kinase
MEQRIRPAALPDVGLEIALDDLVQESEEADEIRFSHSVRSQHYVQGFQIQRHLANGFEAFNFDVI